VVAGTGGGGIGVIRGFAVVKSRGGVGFVVVVGGGPFFLAFFVGTGLSADTEAFRRTGAFGGAEAMVDDKAAGTGAGVNKGAEVPGLGKDAGASSNAGCCCCGKGGARYRAVAGCCGDDAKGNC
jgi:hypothetical protein